MNKAMWKRLKTEVKNMQAATQSGSTLIPPTAAYSHIVNLMETMEIKHLRELEKKRKEREEIDDADEES